MLLDPRFPAQARCVDQADGAAVPAPVHGDGVAGDASLRADEQALLPDQAVDQGGLARIRAPDDGDAERQRGVDLRARQLLAVVAVQILIALILLVRIGLRGGGDQGGEEIAHPLPVLGGQGDGLAKAQREGFRHPDLGGAALGLVGGQHHLAALAAQDLGEDVVQGNHPLPGVDHEQADVGVVHRLLRLGPHAGFQAVVVDVLEACGVDQDKVEVAQPAAGLPPVAGHAGAIVHDGELLARQTIEQGRLADIRPSDNSELQRHGALSANFWIDPHL